MTRAQLRFAMREALAANRVGEILDALSDALKERAQTMRDQFNTPAARQCEEAATRMAGHACLYPEV